MRLIIVNRVDQPILVKEGNLNSREDEDFN